MQDSRRAPVLRELATPVPNFGRWPLYGGEFLNKFVKGEDDFTNPWRSLKPSRFILSRVNSDIRVNSGARRHGEPHETISCRLCPAFQKGGRDYDFSILDWAFFPFCRVTLARGGPYPVLGDA